MAREVDNHVSIGWRTLLRLALGALVVGGAGGLAVYLDFRSAVDSPLLEKGQSKTVTIPEGAGWSETREVLGSAGLVEHPVYFEVWARSRGVPTDVKAGTHHFEGPLTMESLGEALVSGGAPDEVSVTIPEGFTIFEIGDRLEEKRLVDREAFLDAARDDELLAQAGIDADSFEGYLFPDTYRFRKEAAPEAVVWKLYEQRSEVWKTVRASHHGAVRRLEENYGLDRRGIVTLASIVQAETSVDEERPLVARVMLNRLESSMPLQADPTCVYGPNRYDQKPRPELCDDPANRYSTYVIDGLPPGPIGNPGRKSLAAVLAPASEQKAGSYLFYCARRDGTGRHVFSSSYEDHKRAVRKYLK